MTKKSKKWAMMMALCAVVSFFSLSCTSTLYNWDNYQGNYYSYVKNADEKSLNTLIKTYEKMISKPNGTRGVVPPGVYADYGWLLLEAGKTDEAKAMFAKEIELYPESETFVGGVLKRFEK